MSNGNNIDERLKAARERREEQQKMLGRWTSFPSLRFINQSGIPMISKLPIYLILPVNLLSVQSLGSWTGWSGSSGPGATMSSSYGSARRKSWSRDTKRKRDVLPWRKSAIRSSKRKR